MRILFIAVVAIFIINIPLSSAQIYTESSFSLPFSSSGNLNISKSDWVLIILSDKGSYNLNSSLLNPVKIEEYRFKGLYRPSINYDEQQTYGRWDGSVRQSGSGPNTVVSKNNEWSSIFIKGNINILLKEEAIVAVNYNSIELSPNSRAFKLEIPQYAFRPQPGIGIGDSVVRSQNPFISMIHLTATNITAIETQGAISTCDGQPCAVDSSDEAIPYTKTTSAWRWISKDGTLNLTGTNAIVWTGGQGLSVTASGSVRLPALQTSQDLDQFGISVHGETLRGTGDITLSNVRTGPDHRGAAMLSTNLVEASLDGVPLAVSTTATASVASLTLLAVLLWKGKALASYLLSQFTRLDMDAALEHPNRRAIYEYVDANPGPTFRELIRETNMAAGTARHHIAVLGRCDVLIERQYGQTMRYFHRDQEHLGDWDAVVVLRDPEVDRLYRWLRFHPNVIQRAVLDEAEAWGWSRSTAQHRLKKLVDNDLASVRDLGRVKHYHAVDRNVLRHT